MTKILTNPFFIYILSFLIVFSVYSAGWSELYPELSMTVIIFFMVTFIVSFGFGLLLDYYKRIEYHKIEPERYGITFTLWVWLAYGLEFVYNKGIPILIVLRGHGDYNYQLFGIPVFHVFLVTFNSFLAVWFFHQMISRFSVRSFLIFVFNLLPALLIMNRGMLLMILTSCLFIYLLQLKRIRLLPVGLLLILVLVVFYFFGILGNIRQTGKWESEYIIVHGKATREFKESSIPPSYFWSYLYISSPLANFQTTVNKNNGFENDWAGFLNFELLPDFISKRLAKKAGLEKKDGPRVAPWLSVSTFYFGSFVSLGWIGSILMFLFFVGTTIGYVFLLPKKSEFYNTGLAILSSLVLFSTFDNMYAFTGLSFQLIFPVLFNFIKRKSFGPSLIEK